jgi:hypothetical protein
MKEVLINQFNNNKANNKAGIIRAGIAAGTEKISRRFSS